MVPLPMDFATPSRTKHPVKRQDASSVLTRASAESQNQNVQLEAATVEETLLASLKELVTQSRTKHPVKQQDASFATNKSVEFRKVAAPRLMTRVLVTPSRMKHSAKNLAVSIVLKQTSVVFQKVVVLFLTPILLTVMETLWQVQMVATKQQRMVPLPMDFATPSRTNNPVKTPAVSSVLTRASAEFRKDAVLDPMPIVLHRDLKTISNATLSAILLLVKMPDASSAKTRDSVEQRKKNVLLEAVPMRSEAACAKTSKETKLDVRMPDASSAVGRLLSAVWMKPSALGKVE
mmetsp:Transcript_14870/g.36088  ORF Transcript_14870/g.36088 Transcript_14870/m.36088 type:complete len:291 (-) Transcript_14870:1580-2452(-)